MALALAGVQADLPVLIDGAPFHPRRVLVKTQDMTLTRRLASNGVRVIRTMPEIGWIVVEIPGMGPKKVALALRGFKGVEKIELDRAAYPAYTPNDPLYGNQWGISAIKVDKAWDISKGNKNVIVAVLDTGVQADHPDLAANMWVNTGEIAGNGIDDDSNGHIDDVNGYDFVNEDGNPADDHGHGTLCSGVIAAVQDNGIGVSGVAPKARIMAMKVANNAGYFYDSDTAPGYLYAANNGARVFSCSFFSDRVSAVERDALEFAWKKGVLPVVSAGNSSSLVPHYPASHDVALSVAAVASNLSKAGFSNFGANIDVAAPGVGIQTIALGGGYGSYSGTSLSGPMVAGVAALLWSVKPNSSQALIRKLIEDTATPLIQAPYGEYTNYGLVDAEAAMTKLMAGGSPAPRTARFHYITKAGSRGLGKPLSRTRIQGRGFQLPAVVEVKADGVAIPLKARTRDYLEVILPSGTEDVELWVDGGLIATIPQPSKTFYVYPLTEAGTQGGGTIEGGFFQTLMGDDPYLGGLPDAIKLTQGSDNTIFMEGVFRKVGKDATMKMVYRRLYEGTVVGTETVEIYDWSTASYPYGTWATVYSGSVATAMSTVTVSLPGDARRFLDVDGNMYVRIRSSNTIAAGTVLWVDQLHLK